MRGRAGNTEKISVSVRSTDLEAIRKRAKRLYDGNVSAVIAELAADAAVLEGMHELVVALGGPLLTDEDRGALDAEWSAPASKPRGRKRKAKKVAT